MTSLAALQRHELLVQLLRMAREQAEALQVERVDQFLSLMDRRIAVMADLIAIDSVPQPDNVVPFPTVARAGEQGDVDEANRTLITCILIQDEQNEDELRMRMDRLRTAMGLLGQGFAAARGYASTAHATRMSARLDVAY
jgi:hypothetical protein